VPLGYLHPANPVMDPMGVDTEFDLEAHTRFQTLFDQFARPDLPMLRRSILEALDRGHEPGGFRMPEDRFGRATARITLRQQQRMSERHRDASFAALVVRWRQAFDDVSSAVDSDDDAPGH
jgi:hypothetical protein